MIYKTKKEYYETMEEFKQGEIEKFKKDYKPSDGNYKDELFFAGACAKLWFMHNNACEE